MDEQQKCRLNFDELKACVVIPTYNNEKTLSQVIQDVNQYTNHVIVVNDGSTDSTEAIIQQFPTIQLIAYKKNRGKGWALRKSFEYAFQKGYTHAVTIDSDGQHFAKDLPLFIERLAKNKNAIIIGARNMDQETVPEGSSSGNRISNFWFKTETGIDSPDTQSGYRLYPLEPITNKKYITRKYEFEIEVLVRAAWSGVAVESVPVTVYYAPKGQRISHFRPYTDFIRISIMHSILVMISFLYIRPRDFIRGLFEKKNIRQHLHEQLFHPQQTASLKAFSVAFGIFMGIIPIWGFQLLAAIFLAIVFKLNKTLVIIAANISVPPMIPVIIFLSHRMGAIWMGEKAMSIDFSKSITIESVKQNMVQYIAGSFTLAIIAAVLIGFITYFFIKMSNKKAALVR